MAVMTSAHALRIAASRSSMADSYCNPIASHTRASAAVRTTVV